MISRIELGTRESSVQINGHSVGIERCQKGRASDSSMFHVSTGRKGHWGSVAINHDVLVLVYISMRGYLFPLYQTA